MTIVPAPDPLAFDALLSRSWALFRRNWVVALPMVIATGIAIACVGGFAAVAVVALIRSNGMSHLSNGTGAALGISYVALVLALLVVVLWATIATYAMADAAWTRGTTSFADGFAAFPRRVGPVLVALIGLIGVGIVAILLALPTLGLALLALPLVTMYVLPAVIAGGRGGFEAIGESFRLVRAFFVPSLVTVSSCWESSTRSR